jgi:endonuclease YncB( thermonuclease family)
MRILLTAAAATAVLLLGPGLLDEVPDGRAAQQEAAPPVGPPPSPSPQPSDGPLLVTAAHGDGDSWRDTTGTEYRLGLVNAPEVDECFGAEATDERRRLVAAGFRADAYAVDRYGRSVSIVTTADGVNLNVHLARDGFVDDRYLADFRHEHPALAAELDAAFAEARASGRGLWSACGRQQDVPPPAAQKAAGTGCHPDYATCIPVAGDGSGNGGANDLDCGNVPGAVQARQPGVDPYRLDADGDGVGCDAP